MATSRANPIEAGKLRHRITILQQAATTEDLYGTAQIAWVPLATVWAEVQDMLPSRAERIAEGVSVANRPARIRMRYRTDVTTAMRIQHGTRLMQIIAGPAELAGRVGIEVMAEEVSTQGNAL